MTYAYQCDKCGEAFTVRATLAEKERGLDLSCPRCGEKSVTQDLRGVGMGFRGEGGGPPFRGCGPGSGCCG
jgi:putative FmdB family regulatory protein